MLIKIILKKLVKKGIYIYMYIVVQETFLFSTKSSENLLKWGMYTLTHKSMAYIDQFQTITLEHEQRPLN